MFVIYWEYQIIPDELVYVLLGIVVVIMFVSLGSETYVHMLSGFGAASFLLFLNLITLGRGMGLGDVKFAVAAGVLLGWPMTLVWMTMSFVLGAVVGLVLIGVGKAKFGRHIAFGPFLVISLFITMIWGHEILSRVPFMFL